MTATGKRGPRLAPTVVICCVLAGVVGLTLSGTHYLWERAGESGSEPHPSGTPTAGSSYDASVQHVAMNGHGCFLFGPPGLCDGDLGTGWKPGGVMEIPCGLPPVTDYRGPPDDYGWIRGNVVVLDAAYDKTTVRQAQASVTQDWKRAVNCADNAIQLYDPAAGRLIYTKTRGSHHIWTSLRVIRRAVLRLTIVSIGRPLPASQLRVIENTAVSKEEARRVRPRP
jgi:hypothetical protein